jgi:5-methylcytosine-specific restriction endonuclease McrA
MHEHSRPGQANIQQIITLDQAIEAGLKRYFTGEPCRRGHVAPRTTANKACVQCLALWRENNREKCREYVKRWAEENSDFLKIIRKEEYYKNRQSHQLRCRKYYWDNKSLQSLRNAQWKKNNPEKSRVSGINRRARKRLAEGRYGVKDIAKKLIVQRKKCALCRTSIAKKYHVDHIMPLALGGSNWPSNIQLLCPTCNYKKGAKHPVDYAQEIGLLL